MVAIFINAFLEWVDFFESWYYSGLFISGAESQVLTLPSLTIPYYLNFFFLTISETDDSWYFAMVTCLYLQRSTSLGYTSILINVTDTFTF